MRIQAFFEALVLALLVAGSGAESAECISEDGEASTCASSSTIGPPSEGQSLMQSGSVVLPRAGPVFDEFATVPATKTGAYLDISNSLASRWQLPDGVRGLKLILDIFIAAVLFSAIRSYYLSWKYPKKVADLPVSPAAVKAAMTEAKVSGGDVGGSPTADAHARPFPVDAADDLTPLVEAARAGNEAQWRLLLEAKSAGSWKDAYGCTALHVAASCSSASLARVLLERGADVHAREAWEETPLHMAARAGSGEVCELLLKAGADVNAANSDDATPLLIAAKERQEAVCELLLDNDGCPSATGISDADLPHLLTALMVKRMMSGSTATAEAPSDSSEE
mmetsp:Transcript_46803/g.101619  ORF Transcript_46803/g.101619 Transcript_46803/m.101619 type:complete len:338 (-) Transcript_46803:220-1233(-)